MKKRTEANAKGIGEMPPIEDLQNPEKAKILSEVE
jgi:hypothetical protein